jgi:glucose/arabinose dehydrogenase
MAHRALPLAFLLSAIAATAAAAVPPMDTVEVGSGFSMPTFATGAPGDTTHLYVTEKGSGTTASIKVLDLGTHSVTNFLTLSNVSTSGEGGILGLAFDPNYAANKTFYINYTAVGGTAGLSTIAAYQAQPAGDPILVGNILQFDQPQNNHNGGWIGFSPRAGDANNLYIASGDGGNFDDQGPGHIEAGGNAQSNQTLLGKMLRIHVDPATATYTIPANNPFASSSDPLVKKEIFTLGLRNPFRDSFDRSTGTLYIGDVGQGTREEVDVQKTAGGGENYGWRLREGTIATPAPEGGAPPAGNVEPILDYDHTAGVTFLNGKTVIGGYVYRGTQIPGLLGTYIFGDYVGDASGRTEIFALNYDGASVSGVQDLTAMLNPGNTPRITNICSFGEDTLGNLYVVDISSGKIFEIVGVPEPATLAILVLGALGGSGLLTRRASRCTARRSSSR